MASEIDRRRQGGRKVTRDRERWMENETLETGRRALLVTDRALKVVDMALRHKRNAAVTDLTVSPNIAVVGVGETNDAALDCYKVFAGVIRKAGGNVRPVPDLSEMGSQWMLVLDARVAGLSLSDLKKLRKEHKKVKAQIRKAADR